MMAYPPCTGGDQHPPAPRKKSDEKERKDRGNESPVRAGLTHWEQNHQDVKLEGLVGWWESGDLCRTNDGDLDDGAMNQLPDNTFWRKQAGQL